MSNTQPNQTISLEEEFIKLVQCTCCIRHQKNRPLSFDFSCVQECSADCSNSAISKRIAALKECNCNCRQTSRMIVRSLGKINKGFGSYTSKRDETRGWIIVHCNERVLQC
jgi:hypothetical protein